jgi:iron complex transport system ATP-binding protein
MIRVTDLSVDLAGRKVLDGISLDLAEGQVTGLIGPNGAGKTTLLRTMSGLVRPASGHVTLEGRVLGEYSRREIARRIAVVFQEPSPEIAMTVRDMVLLGRNPHVPWFRDFTREDVEIASGLIRETGLPSDRSVTALSSGERQRVILARALAQEPRVLLMDEPAANLDIRHQLSVIDRIRKLASKGVAILIILHDLNLVAKAADRLALLTGGRILASGKPEEVMTVENLREAFGVDVKIITDEDGGAVYSF